MHQSSIHPVRTYCQHSESRLSQHRACARSVVLRCEIQVDATVNRILEHRPYLDGAYCCSPKCKTRNYPTSMPSSVLYGLAGSKEFGKATRRPFRTFYFGSQKGQWPWPSLVDRLHPKPDASPSFERTCQIPRRSFGFMLLIFNIVKPKRDAALYVGKMGHLFPSNAEM